MSVFLVCGCFSFGFFGAEKKVESRGKSRGRGGEPTGAKVGRGFLGRFEKRGREPTELDQD